MCNHIYENKLKVFILGYQPYGTMYYKKHESLLTSYGPFALRRK